MIFNVIENTIETSFNIDVTINTTKEIKKNTKQNYVSYTILTSPEITPDYIRREYNKKDETRHPGRTQRTSQIAA